MLQSWIVFVTAEPVMDGVCDWCVILYGIHEVLDMITVKVIDATRTVDGLTFQPVILCHMGITMSVEAMQDAVSSDIASAYTEIGKAVWDELVKIHA